MRSELEQELYSNEVDWKTATSEKIGRAVVEALRKTGIDERVKHIAVVIDRRDAKAKGWWELAGNVWRLVKKGGDELIK